MKELIRHILKEETTDIKKPFMKYENLINKLVYEIFGDSICGFNWEIFGLENRKGPSIQIVLHFTKNTYQKLDYQRYEDDKQELKSNIQAFLPLFGGIYIAWDTTRCDKDTTSLNENKKRNYLRQLNDIVESYKEDECICDINISYDEDDDMYSVYFVTSTECMAEKFDNSATFIVRKISKIKHHIKQEIKSFLPIENIYVGSYGKPNCDWDPVRRIDENTDKDLSKKIKLTKDLIYDFFGDEVKTIEQSTYNNKPLLKIYYTTDSKAANHSSWLADRISYVVMEYTGNNLILAPWYTFNWDIRKKLADIYIGCEELKTDEDGNELNEIELTEKCWKGYTQKGMKTMFGKRYPNCVKKKKK